MFRTKKDIKETLYRIRYFLYTLLCIYCFSVGTAFAQDIAQADNYYEAQQYYNASKLYEKIVAKDSTAYQAVYQLAHCYRLLYKYEKAKTSYASVVRNAERKFPFASYYYAQMLKYNEQYEEAISWYNHFLDNASSANHKLAVLAETEKEGCVKALLEQSEQKKTLSLQLLPASVNTDEFQEFAPAINQHDSMIAYSSTRLSANEKVSNRSGEGFANQYMVKQERSNWVDISREHSFNRINSKWSDANGSFTADAKSFYFTRCSPASGGYCSIYVSIKKGDKWQEPEKLNAQINAQNSNSKHPSISAGGDTLFFASDRAGSRGGTDIWMASRSDGEWQKVVNLGDKVNSEDNEISPFYSSRERLLIFASDGRQGIGGMDLYMSEMIGSTISTPVPLTAPFNSSKDDCYLVFGEKTVYLSSNRKASFDIYTIEKQDKQTFKQLLQGISTSTVASRQKKGEVFDNMINDYSLLMARETENLTVMRSSSQDYLRSGSSRFVLSADVNDILLEQLRDEQALSGTSSFAISSEKPADSLSEDNLLVSFSTFQVSDEEMVEISGTVYFRNQENIPVTKLSLYLLDQEGNISKITTTNSQGEFRFVNLEASSSYQIRYSETAEVEEQNFKLENLRVFGYGNDFVSLHYENIYFDFNQSYLRNEAQVALDQLAEFHARFPQSVIEINAFTDSTGNDAYNLQLSRERGQTAFNYLLEKGVDRSSLVFNAKGVSTAIASSNTYISQQLNRRVEFYVLGKNLVQEQEVVTRLLRPKVTLYTLANETGMSLDEIKQLNGLSSNELQAYKPIRIYRWAYEQAQGLFYQMQLRSE